MVMRDLSVATGLRVRYTENTGRTRVDIDPLTIRQLRNAYEASRGGECTFFACPGPDARIVPMATCRKCYASIYLRRALTRLGIPTED
jgi:hypothetical protein